MDLWIPYMQFLLVSYRDMLYAFTYKALANTQFALTTDDQATINDVRGTTAYRIFTDWSH